MRILQANTPANENPVSISRQPMRALCLSQQPMRALYLLRQPMRILHANTPANESLQQFRQPMRALHQFCRPIRALHQFRQPMSAQIGHYSERMRSKLVKHCCLFYWHSYCNNMSQTCTMLFCKSFFLINGVFISPPLQFPGPGKSNTIKFFLSAGCLSLNDYLFLGSFYCVFYIFVVSMYAK